jgi:hypothetical protein
MQILKDEATREQYDYAIAHPEEVHSFFFFFFFFFSFNSVLYNFIE